MGLQNAGDVTHRKRAEDLGDFEKVTEREGLIFGARRSQTNLRAKGATRVCVWGGGGQMENSSYKDCASLFLMSKPLTQR